MAAVLGAVLAFPYLYRQVDEGIRTRVEEKIAEHYADLKVTVRSAQLVQGEGIEIRDLSVAEPGATGPRAELLHVEEVLLCCQTDLEELLTGQVDVRRVILRRPTLRATRKLDGSWSSAELLPVPRFSERPPEVIIEHGTVDVVDLLKPRSPGLTLRDVNLTLAPPAPGAAGVAPAPSDPRSHVRKVKGTLAGDFLRRVEIQGEVDPHGGPWSIAGSIEGLEISPELREALPDDLAGRLDVLGSLRGQGAVEFRVRHDPAAEPAWEFELAGQFTRGRYNDARLPHPLTGIRAGFRVENDTVLVENLFAASGPATLWVKQFRRDGFGPNSPMRVEAEIRELELETQLIDVLPEALRRQWPKFLPDGRIHADLKLAYDGSRWHPDVAVQCVDVSFSYAGFPYRLRQAQGWVELAGDDLRASLLGYSEGQAVRISARVVRPTDPERASGWVEVKSQGLPVDEKLLGALRGEAADAARSFSPRGTIDVLARAWRTERGTPLHRHLVLGLAGCAIRPAHFPYPLSNLHGTVEMHDGHWTFRNVEGTNDTGRVSCQGELNPTDEGIDLVLNLTATDVPLDEELRDALGQANVRRLWNDLKLKGRIDLGAEIRYRTGWYRPSVYFRAEPRPGTTSIEPAHFPYRFENLRGAMVYRDGQVTFEGLQAEHGDATLSTGASCRFFPDGSWDFRLENLAIDRLRPDRELIHALPARLRKAVTQLNPSGPIHVRGGFQVSRGGSPDDPLTAQWDVELGLHQGSVDFGLDLENVCGSVRLTGWFDGAGLRSAGELMLDSLTFRDVQFTQVTGPLWLDDQRVLAGTGADRFIRAALGRTGPSEAAKPLRPVSARLFGGSLYGDATFALGTTPHYAIRGSLVDGDLARCAQELIPGEQDLRGRILAGVDLRGTGRGLNDLVGTGTVQLRDADIYELPVMIALLKILSIREPDLTAFSESDIQFRIEGGHIYLDPIDFHGDAISLEGRGEMDFQSAIRLRFRARLGRQKLEVPILKDVLGGASEQFMVVHVTGTLQQPDARTEAFPGVNQALQQIQSDLQRSTAPAVTQDPPAGSPRR